ncbi:MAG: hypothetical protein N0E48_19700 [Candidatus Thiodiazotropha endolucinida]|nr:hypothetical protein [Candidatus Thiodiazotropha taylori]MCW4345561.1 hypothetical protein [Candidatus Thiodiazotropha endolucinida]
MAATPVQDENCILRGFSPVSNWGDFDYTASATLESGTVKPIEERVFEKLNSLEVLIKESHNSTREHMTKGLCELLSYEKALINKVLKNMEEVSTGIQELQSRHQADPALVAGIVALVNQSIKYLQDTAPKTSSQEGPGQEEGAIN